MFAIAGSVCVCVCVCACMTESACVHECVCLGGERSCQTCPTVSSGTILCGLICEGRRAPTGLCYSSVLISSAFRPYLEPVCFFLFVLRQEREERRA